MTAAPPSPELLERARKVRAAIFDGLSRVGQVEVARRLGVVESTVSKAKSDELEAAARYIAASDLKVVPQRFECVDPEVMTALLTLAGQRLDGLRKKPSGLWEHDE